MAMRNTNLFSPVLLVLTAAMATLTVSTAFGEALTVDVWCELEPMVYEGGEYPVSAETAARRMLEEARNFISAMIYGYSFVYTPSDKSRRVAEEFDLRPLAEVAWGDPKLNVLLTEKRGNRMFSKISYRLEDYQLARRRSWGSNTQPSAAGSGKETIILGISAKQSAFVQSLKNAIREYMRKRVFNKPKDIRGDLLLWDPPATIIKAGAYLTTSKIKLSIQNLTPYTVF